MPKQSSEPIYVGCELLIVKGDSILLGLRAKHIFGGGTWALPGGHLEFGERLIEAACREAREELGASVKPEELVIVSIADQPGPSGSQHHVHISFELKEPSWEPRVMEADCQEWRYFPVSNLPKELFPPHQQIVENYLHQRLYAL